MVGLDLVGCRLVVVVALVFIAAALLPLGGFRVTGRVGIGVLVVAVADTINMLDPVRSRPDFNALVRIAATAKETGRVQIPPRRHIVVRRPHAVDKPLDRVAVVVDQEQGEVESVFDDDAEFLGRHLEGAVALEEDGAAGRGRRRQDTSVLPVHVQVRV